VTMAAEPASRLESSLLELLALPPAERIVFRDPPLALVVCQVAFSPVLGVADPSFVFPFQRAIQDRFPLVTPVKGMQLQIGFGSEGGEIKQQEQIARQWQFADQEDNWKLTLSSEFLSLETREYRDFGAFLDRLRTGLEALLEHVQPRLGTRIGLRYINEIRSEVAWTEVIRPEVLGATIRDELGGAEALHQSIQQLLLRYSGGRGINITHGRFPAGTSVQPRAGVEAPATPFYLFDIDVFREYQPPKLLRMDVDSIGDTISSFHEVVHRLFRWAVTEHYVMSLGKSNDVVC
jgi:uncharacterized protein (TIGR04255 family)